MIEAAYETATGVPVTAITAAEMRAVDRVAIEDYGIALLQMMENAGRALAKTVREQNGSEVVVLAGPGGNGGGGLAAARHLHNRGVPVRVVTDRPPEDLDGAPAHQRDVLQASAVDLTTDAETIAGDADRVVVDAVVGYGLEGALRGQAETLVSALASHSGPVVSLDVPSGLDATSGERPGTAITPDVVLTLALPKTGLRAVDVPLLLADIAVPAEVYADLDIPYQQPFDEDVIRLSDASD